MLESRYFGPPEARPISAYPFAAAADLTVIPSTGHAGVAKLAYAQDLKSCGPKGPYGFDPRLLHHNEATKLRCYEVK